MASFFASRRLFLLRDQREARWRRGGSAEWNVSPTARRNVADARGKVYG